MNREEIQAMALKAVGNRKRCGIAVSMGVGKTYIGLQYIDQRIKENEKVLVVAPKRDIFQSWEDDAQKFGIIKLLHSITFSTYISLNKHNPNDYQYVILDEAHSTKKSHRDFLDEYQGHILGLTGTPPKYLNGEKGIMMQEFYPIVYSYKVDQAVENNILNDYRIFVHGMLLNSENNLQIKAGNKQFKTSEQKNYEWLRSRIDNADSGKSAFFAQIMCINALKQYKTKEDYVLRALSRIPSNEKCLIFANTIDQAENLCIYSHHSKKKSSEDLELFKEGKITRLAAVEQLSEGVTIPHLKHIIIMHSYGNERKSSQKIGRALRLNPDETASIHVLVYRNTIDEKWVKTALEGFNQDKIKYIRVETN
jgi:superfamily II DNA or RNA helicase